MIKRQNDGVVRLNPDTSYRFERGMLHLSGTLMLTLCSDFIGAVPRAITSRRLPLVKINLDELEDIDSAGVTTLYYLKRQVGKNGVAIEFTGGSKSIRTKLDLFKPMDADADSLPKRQGLLEIVGTRVHNFFSSYLYGFLVLAADISYWSISDLFRRKTSRKGEFTQQSILIGVNAVFIIMFMAFVIGLVIALQSSYQLRSFGANIYIVDLTVIGMMSQMGPLIAAILVAGRSGSAIAAEIATMQVTSELDALKTMGLNPIRFVVVPKLYACLFVMPFLIIISNIAGILGGAFTAFTFLDITPEIFIQRMGLVIRSFDLVTGFVKSQAYASLIVLTGSYYGLQAVRGAEGVGKATTTAVVVAISLVIIADGIIGLLFY